MPVIPANKCACIPLMTTTNRPCRLLKYIRKLWNLTLLAEESHFDSFVVTVVYVTLCKHTHLRLENKNTIPPPHLLKFVLLV